MDKTENNILVLLKKDKIQKVKIEENLHNQIVKQNIKFLYRVNYYLILKNQKEKVIIHFLLNMKF